MAQVLEDVKIDGKPAGTIIREKRVAVGLSQDGLAAVKGVDMTGLRIARLERTGKGTQAEVDMLLKALKGLKAPEKANPLVGKGRPRGVVAKKSAPAKKTAAKKAAPAKKATPAKKTTAKKTAVSDLL